MITYIPTTESKLDNLIRRGTLPVSVRAAVHMAHLYVTWADRYKARRELAQMPADRLDDIGISPRKALLESRKPFWKP
ncbi:hypothetical protein ATO10_02605 [Actibacterium atlanticum]|uniref:YjiS-like domain-containing protein n=1 Tax=Actibacterium atlanticum TaxID=1461693 RepID=A0A058ZQV8_9RHOB|nr:DUF1127 domain-containing protein [Actibacterium atlanticum]KCV83615.1 hypothetical protein ATO10_02605 [Actibacterium atlanticum]